MVQTTAHRLFSDNPLSEPMMVYCQLDSSLKVSVNFTITGSDNVRRPKYLIQGNTYENVDCSNGTQFFRSQFVK